MLGLGEVLERSARDGTRQIEFVDIDVPPGRDPVDAVVAMLVESIPRVGLIQPAIVVEDGERFRLVAGRNRMEALRRLGSEYLVCLVVQPDQLDAEGAAIDENLCRRQLTAEEQAELRALRKRMIAARAHKSARQVAREVGTSEPTVRRRKRSVASDDATEQPATPAPKVETADGKRYPARRAGPDEVAERRRKAAALRAEGKPVRAVAEALGVSVGTAAADVKQPAAPAQRKEVEPAGLGALRRAWAGASEEARAVFLREVTA